MIATIATITSIAGKTFSNRCDHMGTTLQRSIVALTSFHNDREDWFLYDCNDCDHRDRSNRTETSLYFQYISVV